MMVVPEGGSLFQHNMTHGGGRAHRRRALDPGGAVYDDVMQLWAQTQGRLHADAGRRLRRHLGRALLVRSRRTSGRTRGCSTFVPRARPRRALAPPRRWRRRTSSTTSASRRSAKELHDAGVSVQLGAHGQREGLGGALGALDVRPGRHDAARGAARGDARAARSTSASTGHRLARAGQARRPRGPRRNPLEDIRNTNSVSRVMVNGRLYDAATMNEVAPRQKPRPRSGGRKGSVSSSADALISGGGRGRGRGRDRGRSSSG